MLNGLKHGGIDDIIVACFEELRDFANDKKRVSVDRQYDKYVSYQDINALMADLKRVYVAVDKDTA